MEQLGATPLQLQKIKQEIWFSWTNNFIFRHRHRQRLMVISFLTTNRLLASHKVGLTVWILERYCSRFFGSSLLSDRGVWTIYLIFRCGEHHQSAKLCNYLRYQHLSCSLIVQYLLLKFQHYTNGNSTSIFFLPIVISNSQNSRN